MLLSGYNLLQTVNIPALCGCDLYAERKEDNVNRCFQKKSGLIQGTKVKKQFLFFYSTSLLTEDSTNIDDLKGLYINSDMLFSETESS